MRLHGTRRAISSSIRISFIALVLYLCPRTAYANLTNLCWIDQSTHPWYGLKADIPIYYNNVGVNSALAITGLSDYDMSVAIKRATTIWNEYSGASVKLRFAGTTSLTYKDHAVVIFGDSTTACNAVPDCDSSPNACAPAETRIVYNEGNYFGTQVLLFAQFQGGGGNCTSTAGQWRTGLIGTQSNDLVAVLVHELGHGVFNMGHPGEPTPPYGPSCADLNVVSVMTAPSPKRELSNWDREIAQQRYGVRSPYSYFYQNKMASDTSWFGSAQFPYFVSPLFRAGSVSNNWPSPNTELGWVYGGTTVQAGGAGLYNDVGMSNSSVMSNWYHLATSSVAGPIAIATKPTSGQFTDAIFAYLKFASQANSTIYTDTAAGTLCYRRSTNAGVTWGSEICTDSYFNTSFRTSKTGVTAACDPYSNAFLIAIARNDTIKGDIVILTVPASGTAPPVSRFTVLGISTLHAPSIACTGAANGCLVAYEGIDGSGSLTGTFVGVSTSTGAITKYSTYQWGIPFWDTPGLTYKSDDNTFRLAQTDSNSFIYSYRMSNADPTHTWYGNGDIWNNSLSHVSTAAMAIQYSCPTCRSVSAWFVKFW